MSKVFEFHSYKDYLKAVLVTTGDQRGIRSRLAQHVGCQVSFLSQVLNGNTHVSLEYGLKISQFLGHSSDESHFFMLMLEEGRAGSKDLKAYFDEQMEQIRTKRKDIGRHIRTDESLNIEAQSRYYSAWYYAAVHVAISVPELQTPPAISERFSLPLKLVVTVLEFLESVGLAKFAQGKYVIGPSRIHLSRESPLISKHHFNWRLQSMHRLEKQLSNEDDLHYSSVYSIAKQDISKVRNIILDAIDKFEPLIVASKEEDVVSVNLDLFRI